MHKSDPAVLNPADRARLAGILGLLSSTVAGERDAAAHAATRFLKARDLRWSDILDVAPADGLLDDLAGRWRDAAATCVLRGSGGILSPWELGFCRSLVSFSRCSDKQLEVLRRLVDKLMLAEVMT
jgi:hypothetical protein